MSSQKKGISFGNVRPATYDMSAPASSGFQRGAPQQVREERGQLGKAPVLQPGDPRRMKKLTQDIYGELSRPLYPSEETNPSHPGFDPAKAWLKGGKKHRSTRKRRSTKKRGKRTTRKRV